MTSSLFDIAERHGHAQTARSISRSRSTISRLVRGITDIDSALIATAAEAFDGLDVERTLGQWYRARLAFLADSEGGS